MRALLVTRGSTALALAVAASTLVGCGQDPADLDCTAKVRYEGRLYSPLSEPAPATASAEPLGAAEIVGCGSVDDAVAVAEVDVSTVGACPSADAVRVVRGDHRGVYVADGAHGRVRGGRC